MRVITRRDRIKGVADAWEKVYGDKGEIGGPDKLVILEKLRALNLNRVGRKVVDEIIGNQSWTKIKCDNCEKDVDVAAEFNSDAEGYDDWPILICGKCLKKATKMLKEPPCK